MARTNDNSAPAALLPDAAVQFLRRRVMELSGIALVALGVAIGIALVSYSPADPSINSAAEGPIANWLGRRGALIADLLLQTIGLAAAIPVLVVSIWGGRVVAKRGLQRPVLRLTLIVLGCWLAAVVFSALPTAQGWPLRSGMGGVVGTVALEQMMRLGTLAGWQGGTWPFGLIALVPAIPVLAIGLGLTPEEWRGLGNGLQRMGSAILRLFGAGGRAFGGRIDDIRRWRQADENDFLDDDRDVALDDLDDEDLAPAKPRKAAAPKRREPTLVEPKAPKPKSGKKAEAARQRSLDLPPTDGQYHLPPLDLLDAPGDMGAVRAVNQESLQQNARLLESVLNDFGVKGEITKVRPGPVVTLYELEPAPGTKTSRVIGLSDDIARSMSAISVRVAVIPGRSVIGIELPNVKREMVFLREMLESENYEKAPAALPLALGKDIGGGPITVDLARMPHLLIAGTTGSGKSVAVNTMILSLLYRLTPDQCRFIMIDPKMLELSVYEGIPHLLAPVVTEPGKAVVALKWTVREMEDRYRAMANLGVRNINGYNARIKEAAKAGQTLTRRVQTGFDLDSGKPIYEDQPLSTEPLPYIVVIVDEMADLMLVAGKDIEGAIQRLAQMARAAGIHIVMATQRPSVDVITGTIKANFPTRISFQVTSKIDSRTILGEQGAEQLLGQGDMLYMAGGGRISRVHGPFVSDEEVEDAVAYLKTQGTPDYVEAVTEEIDEPGAPGGDVGGNRNSGDPLYDEAVAIVAREGKASTSFVQRQLQIGYNRAARMVEQMEAEGVVSKPDRVGRREVLVSDHSAA